MLAERTITSWIEQMWLLGSFVAVLLIVILFDFENVMIAH